jgi:hypothetical protein
VPMVGENLARREDGRSMRVNQTIRLVLLFILIATTLVLVGGCGVVGADIRLEGLSLGKIAIEGKAIEGLPSDKINLSLDVAAQSIEVETSASGTTLTLSPSGATIEIYGDTVSFKGLKPEQVKVEWAVGK